MSLQIIFKKRQFPNQMKMNIHYRERKRTEPNRTPTDILKNESNRIEPNPNRLFESSVEPNRTRTG